jgi:hypothetical protein
MAATRKRLLGGDDDRLAYLASRLEQCLKAGSLYPIIVGKQ